MKELNEKLKKPLVELLKAVMTALIAFITATLSSCGMTRATVVNHATGTETSIKITTNNPTSVSVPTNAELQFNKK